MLPETTRTRIEREADEYARTYTGTKLIKRPYIAGATAEAEFNRIAYDELREKVQKMTDALESVKKDLEVIIEVYPTLAAAKVGINTIDNALQKWRGEK